MRTAPGRPALVALIALACIAAAAPARAADEPVDPQRRRVYLLIKDLGDAKGSVRFEAEAALKRLGNAALEDVIAALDNRHRAVSTMDADRNPVARSRAAKVLGSIGGERAATHLITALDDRSSLVRGAACSALGEMRWKPAVPGLIRLADGDDATVAGDAAAALGSIGGDDARKTLERVLGTEATLKRKYKDAAAVARVRSHAAFALGRVGDKAAVPALVTALTDGAESVRSSAALALGMIGDTAAVPGLLAALDDGSVRVRRAADLALRKMSGQDVGFDSKAAEPERKKAARAWRAYWRAKLK